MLHRRSYGRSDVGRHRPHNEDSFLADDALGVYVVADGVGGHAKGEVASAQAVEEIYGYIRREYQTIDTFQKTPNPDTLFGLHRLMESAVQAACYMVFGMAELDPKRRGMSTTISALLVVDTLAVLAQVGDSRVYRLRKGSAVQLTEDHTLINYKLKHGLITAEEAAKAPGKNVITRAVGHRDYVQVDTAEADVADNDRFLLCSDGLHGYLKDDEVATVLGAGPIETVAQQLIELANQRGGRDNITALLVDAVAE
ncbi:MAG: serine/threonine-protein phosphatase [Deltaproteobacteria bacterium]|nr:serine/threonine-protein phosphatase [Deltaproteobacteria bacterium]